MPLLAESGKLQELLSLVAKFRGNLSQYTDKNYKEQRLRMDFVDKLFELLDWDISNKEGAIEEFRDVVIEDNLEIAGTQKYPDYTFRIGNEPVFFVETKKPAIYLKDSVDPAYQVRRYGYTAKKKISILTDFQEFAIYDARIKPGKNDRAAVARLFYCTFEEYEKNWEFLYELLSKDAVKRGSLSKYAGSGTRRGYSEVDKDFLALIEKWRSELAKNIAKNNKKTELDGINKAVQKIIDRIIFLRICEEKGIEQFENLKNIGQEKRVYENLVKYFERANKKYNSELFKPDKTIDSLDIDGDILGGVIKALYYPECPYAFSVLPVEILGNIYEQFLGKTIRLTESHLAKIEEKPEARKAGGVYYTPKHIVDYIVKNTVGEKIKGLAPKEIEKIKILDPACGSGSFLLGAYSYLLDYHLSYFSKKERLAKALKDEKIYQARANSYHLTIREKQNILLNNIFGVDIDAQAVEVTKLSLMLKLLEGESDESAGKLFKYSDEKLLPTLSNNIKCGNSLIGSDFYKDKNLSLFGDEEMKKINVFDWDDKEKGFGEIMANGGFDCVIGNPPWGQKAVEFSEEEKLYLSEKYPASTVGIYDLFRFFIECSLKLLSDDAYWGQVLPDIVLLKNYDSTRKLMLDTLTIKQIDHWGMAFEGVNLEACTIIGYLAKKSLTTINIIQTHVHNEGTEISNAVEQKLFNELEGYKFNLYLNPAAQRILKKISKFDALSAHFESHEGIHSGNIRTKLFIDKEKNVNCKKLIFGRDEIQRYFLCWSGKWVNYSKDIIDKKKDEYAGLGRVEYFEQPKIVVRRTGDYILANLDDKEYYFSNNVFVCLPKSNAMNLKYTVGLLNSKLLTWFYRTVQPRKGKLFAELKINVLSKIPIVAGSKKTQEKMIVLVDQMLETQKLAHSAKTESDKRHYQLKIEILDRQIDDLVYELYGLTPEEIKVVEGDG